MPHNKISTTVAQEIVNAVKEVVGKDINFIDKKGIIIGSTDKTRLNTFHEAGYEAIKTHNNITVKNEDSYKGSKSGINYPIKIDDKAIGAIGITGEPEDISKYGFLVTKITEIFIKEQQLNYTYEADKHRINYVVKSLIYNSIEDKEEIENILQEYTVPINQKFAVVVLKINKCDDIRELEDIENHVKKAFDELGNIFKIYIYPNEFIAILSEESYDKIKKVSNTTLKKFEGKINGGVGRLKELYNTYISYQEARIAMKYNSSANPVLTYLESLNLEIIIESIQENIRRQYIEKVLKNLSKEDVELLKIYYRNDMSLKDTSGDLFIHKNTLQYRLSKIYEKSGFNPKNFNDSVILYMAILLKG